MSAMLVFKWLTPAFAVAVVATVWIVGGPMAAGLCMIAFLLGVASCELHHMRWTAVEDAAPAAESDSAFMALMAAGAGVAPAATAAATPVEKAAAIRQPPKRNFRVTSYGIATGSGEIRLELVERRQLHAKAAADSARRRAAGAHAWPARTPAAAATSPQTVVQAQAEAPLLEPPVLELAPEMIRPSLEDEARKAEVPNTPEAATALQRPAPRTATPARAQHVEPPPPSVFVKAPPAPARKREPTEAFRSSYQQGPR